MREQLKHSAALSSCDDSDHDPEDDHENNGHDGDDREDLAEHPANADILLIRVLDTRRLDFLLGLVSEVPGDRREDCDEDSEDPEDQDQGSLRVLLRRCAVGLAIWHM